MASLCKFCSVPNLHMDAFSSYRRRHALFVLFFFYLRFFSFLGNAASTPPPLNNSATAVLVFGDSTVDPGNNNYVGTIFRANFLPYGKDFPGQTPTGRFSNGRLATDFIAQVLVRSKEGVGGQHHLWKKSYKIASCSEIVFIAGGCDFHPAAVSSYVGVKENVPPFLDPTLSLDELITGVSFASAGTGYDPLTPTISSVVSIPEQLELFKEYKRKVGTVLGKKKMEEHIRKSIFIISAGTNDFVINYFALPIRRKTFSVSAYQQFIIHHLKQFLQGLWDEGARRIGIAGLPPMGCLPIVITINSNNVISELRDCVESYNIVAKQYNKILQNEINLMNLQHLKNGGRIYTIDIYSAAIDMIQGQERSSFDEVSFGCCGSGIIEASFLCNPGSLVCYDASKYVFFDSIHPTEKSYYNLFKAVRPVIDLLTS